MGITKSPRHLPSAATLALRNLAGRLIPPQVLVAIWDISTFPLVKVKATIHRSAPILVMLKHYMIINTRQLTAALCHAYVPFITLTIS